MSFYQLTKESRQQLVAKINIDLHKDFASGFKKKILKYYGDEDTYIRKAAYQQTGRLYFSDIRLGKLLISVLLELFQHENYKIRQTVINAAGEIGKKEFTPVTEFFNKGLFDEHHAPRNAVIGSIKKMGEVNPGPVLQWAKQWLHHPDKEIRREICHGIELSGRKYPQDILPLLQVLQNDPAARVRNTLVHVLGQISYKKGCLETVIGSLNQWENRLLVKDAIVEIIDVHNRYRNFSYYTQPFAIEYIDKNLVS